MDGVSIALCTFNGENFLSEQLNSYAEQSRLPDELIICDDGSTDRTIAILKEFARNSRFPVEIYENETNLGFERNFEKAVALCKREIIFFSDQDDYWMPDKIETISKNFLDDSKLGMVFTDAELVDEKLTSLGVGLFDVPYNARVRGALRADALIQLLLFKNHITGATAAFRRNLLEYALPFPRSGLGLNHDGWIGFLGTLLGNFAFVDRPLIKYRQHPGQLIGVYEVKPRKPAEGPEPRWGFEEASVYVRSDVKRISAILEYFQKEEKLSSLLPSLEKTAVPIISELKRKLGHYSGRNNLPPSFVERSRYVWNEALTGNYHQFSCGLRSIAKDVLYLGQKDPT